MELRKKSSGSISIFHLLFSLFGSSIPGLTYMKYEQTGRIISYPFISFPRYTQQASLHTCNKYGKFILVISIII